MTAGLIRRIQRLEARLGPRRECSACRTQEARIKLFNADPGHSLACPQCGGEFPLADVLAAINARTVEPRGTRKLSNPVEN